MHAEHPGERDVAESAACVQGMLVTTGAVRTIATMLYALERAVGQSVGLEELATPCYAASTAVHHEIDMHEMPKYSPC